MRGRYVQTDYFAKNERLVVAERNLFQEKMDMTQITNLLNLHDALYPLEFTAMTLSVENTDSDRFFEHFEQKPFPFQVEQDQVDIPKHEGTSEMLPFWTNENELLVLEQSSPPEGYETRFCDAQEVDCIENLNLEHYRLVWQDDIPSSLKMHLEEFEGENATFDDEIVLLDDSQEPSIHIETIFVPFEHFDVVSSLSLTWPRLALEDIPKTRKLEITFIEPPLITLDTMVYLIPCMDSLEEISQNVQLIDLPLEKDTSSPFDMEEIRNVTNSIFVTDLTLTSEFQQIFIPFSILTPPSTVNTCLPDIQLAIESTQSIWMQDLFYKSFKNLAQFLEEEIEVSTPNMSYEEESISLLEPILFEIPIEKNLKFAKPILPSFDDFLVKESTITSFLPSSSPDSLNEFLKMKQIAPCAPQIIKSTNNSPLLQSLLLSPSLESKILSNLITNHISNQNKVIWICMDESTLVHQYNYYKMTCQQEHLLKSTCITSDQLTPFLTLKSHDFNLFFLTRETFSVALERRLLDPIHLLIYSCQKLTVSDGFLICKINNLIRSKSKFNWTCISTELFDDSNELIDFFKESHCKQILVVPSDMTHISISIPKFAKPCFDLICKYTSQVVKSIESIESGFMNVSASILKWTSKLKSATDVNDILSIKSTLKKLFSLKILNTISHLFLWSNKSHLVEYLRSISEMQIKQVKEIEQIIQEMPEKIISFDSLGDMSPLHDKILVLVPSRKLIPFWFDFWTRENRNVSRNVCIVEYSCQENHYFAYKTNSRESKSLKSFSKVVCIISIEEIQEFTPFDTLFDALVSIQVDLTLFPILFGMSIQEKVHHYHVDLQQEQEWKKRFDQALGVQSSYTLQQVPKNVEFVSKTIQGSTVTPLKTLIALDSIMQRQDVLMCLKSRFGFDLLERPSHPFGDADLIVNQNKCIVLFPFEMGEKVLMDKIALLSKAYTSCCVIVEYDDSQDDFHHSMCEISLWMTRIVSMTCGFDVVFKISSNCDITCEYISMEATNHVQLSPMTTSNIFFSAFPSLNWFNLEQPVSIQNICKMSVEEVSKTFETSLSRANQVLKLLESEYKFHSSPIESSIILPSPNKKRGEMENEEEPFKKKIKLDHVKRGLFQNDKSNSVEISLNRSVESIFMESPNEKKSTQVNIFGPKSSSMRPFLSPPKYKK